MSSGLREKQQSAISKQQSANSRIAAAKSGKK